MLAVLVVIGIIAALLVLTQPKDEKQGSQSPILENLPATILVINMKNEDVQSIKVENTFGEYTVVASENDNYTLKNLDKANVNSAALSSLVSSVFPLIATNEIATYNNLEDFGLDGMGQATVTLTYEDASTDKLVIGLSSPSSGGTYILKDKSIYIVKDFSTLFFQSELDFVETSLINIADSEETDAEGNALAGADRINSLTLSGTNFAKEISIIENDNNLSGAPPNKIILPIKADVNASSFVDIVTDLKTVNALKAVKVVENEDDFVNYGLENPYAKAEYTLNGESHVVKVSAQNESGMHYITADDMNVIYEISSAAVSSWCNADLMGIRASYLLLADIYNVQSLTFKKGENTVSYEINREIDESQSTDKSKRYFIRVIQKGKAVSFENEYKPLFLNMLSMEVVSSDNAEYAKEATYNIELRYFENEPTNINFYETEDGYAFEVNGEYSGLLHKQTVEDFFESLLTE